MTAPAKAAGTVRLRHNRAWKLLWLGQAVSIMGDYVFDTTVVLWISTVIASGQDWAATAVSGVLIAAAAPALLVGPLAGVFVDRWDRRRIMLVSDGCRAVIIVALLPLAVPSVAGHLSPLARVLVIYLAVAAASCFAQFFNPSRFAMLGAVVDAGSRPRASGMLQATGSFAAILGPPLAAPLLFVLGVQWALVINALSFVVSFVTLRLMRLPAAEPRPAARSGFSEEFAAGLRFFAGNKVLIALAIGAIVATLGTGALNALNVFFVTGNLHAPVKWYGTLGAAEAIGAGLGGLGAGWIAARVGSARVFWAGLILTGAALIAYSRADDLITGLVALGCGGFMLGALNTVLSPLMLGVTPSTMIGRVVAVVNPVQQLAAIVSMAAAGFLASTALRGFHHVIAGVAFGTDDTVFAVAGLMFVAAGLATIRPLRAARADSRAEVPPMPPVLADETAGGPGLAGP